MHISLKASHLTPIWLLIFGMTFYLRTLELDKSPKLQFYCWGMSRENLGLIQYSGSAQMVMPTAPGFCTKLASNLVQKGG
ncbi:hypothetical protein N7493_002590 [Penicillium malachiteum]|uniref:Uncharacterized protein n=1 Tax=Penicillium malachiteum TaxID=1324776 RepID=A0AAD6HS97_9EURO|nr:hypothetical protein N7493_002590 [Penicillium malachiteum]